MLNKKKEKKKTFLDKQHSEPKQQQEKTHDKRTI